MIRNLISNALKFTPHKGSVVIETGKVKNEGKDRLKLKITDTGTGMSEEVISKLMNKNIHFTTYGTDNEKGSGLGFQLCKEFIYLNKGDISIESQQGSGSTFNIYLPVDQSKFA